MVFSIKPNAKNYRDLDFSIELNFKDEFCQVNEPNTYLLCADMSCISMHLSGNTIFFSRLLS